LSEPSSDPRPGLVSGDVVDLSIEKAVYQGQGLGRHQGQVVFVPGAFPGDRLRVRVSSVSRDYARAAIETVLEPSRERRPAPCRFHVRCGGCSYQELGYEAQRRIKGAVLAETLRRGGLAWEEEIEVVASPEQGWRTRARFHLTLRGGTPRLGLYQAGSREVVDLDECLQVSAAMNRALGAMRREMEARPDVWRQVHGIELAESDLGDRLVAALDTSLPSAQAARLHRLAGAVPDLTGLGVLPGRAGRRSYLHLKGEPYVTARVAGLELRAHVGSFFQGNRFLLEPLVREVVDRTPEGGTVLDLYAGVGLFALALAGRAERVLAVEHSAAAARDASFNARTAGIGNLRVERRRVEEMLRSGTAQRSERVILDPPRTGAGEEVVAAVAARHPESVVYVSCDPTTLARDLRRFGALGYRPASIRGFDLFPDTYHLETVVQLLPR
jgi:23S rRNA (uracil1939-C5)-methyltransferase